MNRTGWIVIGVVVIGIISGLWWFRMQATTPTYVCSTVRGTGCVNPTPSASNSSADRTLTDTNNGSSITLTTGQSVALRLDTHSGGGYQYSLDDYDQAMLRLDKDETIEPNSKDASGQLLVGAGNLEQWTFTALKPGTTVVKLTNFRSFEPRPTTPTFTVTITVN